MLYQLGPVTIDVFPFSIDEVGQHGSADFAQKELLGRLCGQEFMGEGEDTLNLRGQILPQKTGGLEVLEGLHRMLRLGEPFYVLRGDGKALGWYILRSISQTHGALRADGRPEVVSHDLSLSKVYDIGSTAQLSLVHSLLSLFSQ